MIKKLLIVVFVLLFSGAAFVAVTAKAAFAPISVPAGGTGTTTAPFSQLLYGGGGGTYQSTATTSASCSGNTTCTTFTVIGGSPITISSTGGGTGLSTTSPISGSDVLVYSSTGAGAAYGSGTSTPSIGTVITYSGTLGKFIGGVSGTFGIANSAVTNAMLQNSTISGIALGSNLGDLTATNGTLTFSGTYNGSTARTIGLNLGNANSWTALQQFNANASTTQFSAGRLYIGLTATTTIDGTGNIVIPSGSGLTNTGRSDGCATWASAVLTSTGVACGSGGGATTEKWATTTGAFLALTPNVGNNVGLGIGTATPIRALSLSSSTAPQLSLSDSSNSSAPWNLRSINSNLYIATSSPTTFATSSASALVIDSSGSVGIGTNTPMTRLSVAGEVNVYGNYAHYGPVPSLDTSYCVSGKQCLMYAGNDNTLAGVGIYTANYNAGASSYSIFQLENDRTDAGGTHYAGVSLNSSGYNDNTYGSAFNYPDVLQLINADAQTSFITNTNNVAGRTFFNFVGGGSSNLNEIARLNTTGFGFGTTSPHAALSVNAGSTSPTKNLIEASYSTGAANAATTTIFSVASSTATSILIGTTTPANGSASATTTIYMQKIQFQGGDSGGVTRCVFMNSSGSWSTQAGACL